jgi:predicted O-linked N-acetylglucosamine transferase (SPINDLY family)
MAMPSPVFSVVWCAQGGTASVQESLAALSAQSLQDFEFIVASDEAGSPGERLLAALRRCRGTYIAIHPGNGHFRPDALAFAAAELGKAGEAGGLCCAGFLLDEDGPVAAPADIVSILLFGYRLGLASGFLKRQALVDCGLDADDWPIDSLGLEIWTRIAVDFGIRSVDRLVLDCARPQDDVIAPPEDIEKAIDARMSALARHFSRAGFFQGAHMALLMESQLNQLSSLRGQLPALGLCRSEPVLTAALQKVVAGLRTLLASDHRVLRILDRQSLERAHALGLLAAPVRWFLRETGRMKGRFPIHAGYTFWNFPLLGRWCTRKMFVEASPQARPGSEEAHATKFADVYAVAALLYEARGQIEQALLMCSRAAPSHDITIDNLASQAQLKLAGTSEVDLAEAQRRRMKPYVRECKSPFVRTARAPGRKIRVGYHCAFMNLDTIYFQLRNAIGARDRDRFEVYGYSPQKWVEGRTPPFDRFRHVPSPDEWVGDAPAAGGRRLSDDDFVDLVRADELDVLVELTGFSPGNRLVAMSRRCAPVQVNYINHLGTCGLPNIDYVLGDEIAAPPVAAIKSHYLEQVYRLPGCFFCFDYRQSDEAPVVDPPSASQPFVTFGYLGSGGKLNIGGIELWSRLLHRVPGSRLHLQNFQLKSADNQRFMIDRFARFGIPADRLIIAGGVERRKLTRLYDRIDISLDTTPYCGGNTIAESFWQGVPVVTLRGDKFVSNYGASLVTAAGCPELVAGSADEYVEIAAALSQDKERLRFLRHNLRRMSTEGGLNDSQSLARRLEAAYVDMLDRARTSA